MFLSEKLFLFIKKISLQILFIGFATFLLQGNRVLAKDKTLQENRIRMFSHEIISLLLIKNENIPNEARKVIAKYPKIFTDILARNKLSESKKIILQSQLPINLSIIVEILDILEEAKKPILMKFISKNFIEEPVYKYSGLWDFIYPEDRVYILEKVPDEIFMKMANILRKYIEEINFSKDPAIQILKDNENGIDISSAPQSFVDLLHLFIDQYFDKMSFKDRVVIISSLLNLPLPVDDSKKLSVFLNQVGPTAQKFFQLMGDNGKSIKIRETIGLLKSNVKKFSYEKAKKQIEESYGVPLDEMFSNFNKKPLAAATIAQVHLATMKESGEQVVVKIRRPGIEKKAKKEIKILKELTKNTSMYKIIESLEKVILEEIDFRIEAEYLEKGQVYKNAKRGIHVVSQVKGIKPQKKILLMSLAEGESINKSLDEYDLINKAVGLRRLYEIWIKSALFGDGFFHGDLHSGNLFYKKTEKKPGYKLTLIDFGSVGELSIEERRSLIKLGLGIYISEPKLIMNGFRKFEKMSCSEAKEFYNEVRNIFVKDISIEMKTTEILNLAVQNNFEISKNYIQFNRGKVFIEEHINKNNKRLDKSGLNVKLKTPEKIYANVLLRKMPNILNSYFFGKSKNYETLIDKFTFKISWQYLSSHYLKTKMRLLPYDICKGR